MMMANKKIKNDVLKDVLMQISKLIKASRAEHGISQARLAREIGCNPHSICRLEGAKYYPASTATLIKIATAFGKRLKITFEDIKDDAQKTKALKKKA